jgi:hypothetical protein
MTMTDTAAASAARIERVIVSVPLCDVGNGSAPEVLWRATPTAHAERARQPPRAIDDARKLVEPEKRRQPLLAHAMRSQ